MGKLSVKNNKDNLGTKNLSRIIYKFGILDLVQTIQKFIFE